MLLKNFDYTVKVILSITIFSMKTFTLQQEEEIKEVIKDFLKNVRDLMWKDANLNANIRNLILDVIRDAKLS